MQARREGLKPPPNLSLVEWADEYRQVSKKNSAEPGKWRTNRVPVAQGPYLAITEAETHTVTVVSSTQLLKTEFLLNTACYFIHQDPASILFVQPTQKLAEDFSKERFAPTRESTPAIRALIPDSKARDSGVTITHKEYPGGTLDFVGANSPVDLASRPKRIVLSDEIDKYPPSAGSEGDPLSLAEERSSTFWNRKRARACSPTDEATSRIWREYLQSDQRKCFVPCRHCGHRQTLYWSERTVIWDKDADGNHLPDSVNYHCEECGAGWSEAERRAAIRSIVDLPDKGWRQTKKFRCCGEEHGPSEWDEQGRSLCPECGKRSPYYGHAGFQASKLYSTRHKLADLVLEWLGAQKSPEKIKKFVNTGLAEPTRENFEVSDPRALKERVEPYSYKSLPSGIRLASAGVDTQDDRLEVTKVGWGTDEEAWVIRHVVLHGDTAKKKVWDELDELLKERYDTADGRSLMVQATCVDSQGHRGAQVHAFCRTRKGRRIYPTKGMANVGRGARPIWPKTPSRTKNSGDRLYIIGVDTAKDDLHGRLAILPDPGGGPIANAIHFPQDDLPADYFEQLTAEKAITVFENGNPRRKWIPKEEGARNEALDCWVGAKAARDSLPIRLDRPPMIGRRRSAPPKASQPKPPVDPAPESANTAEDAGRKSRRSSGRDRKRWKSYTAR